MRHSRGQAAHIHVNAAMACRIHVKCSGSKITVNVREEFPTQASEGPRRKRREEAAARGRSLGVVGPAVPGEAGNPGL